LAAAVALPAAALAQPLPAPYWSYSPPPQQSYYLPQPPYYPQAQQAYYPQPVYYPQPRVFPPWWYYDPYRNPYGGGYTLVNPDYNCVWEGRGCPVGR
jgi:hypothetical protein